MEILWALCWYVNVVVILVTGRGRETVDRVRDDIWECYDKTIGNSITTQVEGRMTATKSMKAFACCRNNRMPDRNGEWMKRLKSDLEFSSEASLLCFLIFQNIYIIWQSDTTFYCIKYISQWYLKDDNYKFRLSYFKPFSRFNSRIFQYTYI